jgi:hypothetical protein
VILEEAFRKSKSWRIVHEGQELWLHHQFPVENGQRIRVVIEAFDSDWGGLGQYQFREGVAILADNQLQVGGVFCRLLTLLPYPAPSAELRPLVEELRLTEFGSVHAEAGIEGRLCLWLDKPFQPVELVCHTQDGHVHVWNVWNNGNLRHAIHGRLNGAAMIVEEIDDGFRYRCNDGYPDDDFDDIVFRIERC